MNVEAFIEAYGLPGLIIFGLGWAVVHLWRALQASQEARIEDNRSAARDLREVAEASRSSIDSLTRVLEREGLRDP